MDGLWKKKVFHENVSCGEKKTARGRKTKTFFYLGLIYGFQDTIKHIPIWIKDNNKVSIQRLSKKQDVLYFHPMLAANNINILIFWETRDTVSNIMTKLFSASNWLWF